MYDLEAGEEELQKETYFRINEQARFKLSS